MFKIFKNKKPELKTPYIDLDKCKQDTEKIINDSNKIQKSKISKIFKKQVLSEIKKIKNVDILVNCNICNDKSGDYNFSNYEINLCCNQFEKKNELKKTLIHELIHAYDHMIYENFNCRIAACSEIRAYNLSDKCEYFKDSESFSQCLKKASLNSMKVQKVNFL
jgi:hypothetical protein